MHLATILYTALLRTQLEEYSVKFIDKQLRFDKIIWVENKKNAESLNNKCNEALFADKHEEEE